MSSIEANHNNTTTSQRHNDTMTAYAVLTISSKDAFSYPAININVVGQVDLKLESAPKDNIPPRTIMDEVVELRPAGKFAKQTVEEIPFSFPLAGSDGKILLETYHGVYVNIMYVVSIVLERGKLKRKLDKEVEFIVEVPVRRKDQEDLGAEFCITPETCDNVEKVSISSLPKFKITGRMHHKTCLINLPFTGEVKVELAETPIESIELQLVRCESVSESLIGGEGMTREVGRWRLINMEWRSTAENSHSYMISNMMTKTKTKI